MSKQTCLPPGTILENRYVIDSVIAEGGFGIIYQGRNERVHIRVAIKELFLKDSMMRDTSISSCVFFCSEDKKQEFLTIRSQFLEEARVLGYLSGLEGICEIIDYFEDNGTAYLVMNYIDGPTLQEYILTNEISPVDIGKKMLPLIKVLQQIHEAGYIHRDISPDNILASDHGFVLIDFGGFKNCAEITSSRNTVLFKSGYAPIEQFRNSAKQGPWTDVYGLSATLYYCLTKTPPPGALARNLLDEIVWPSELNVTISKDYENVLKRGLAVKPKDRYQTAEEFYEALKTVLYPNQSRKYVWFSAIILAVFIILLGVFLGGRLIANTISDKSSSIEVEDKTLSVISPNESTSMVNQTVHSDASKIDGSNSETASQSGISEVLTIKKRKEENPENDSPFFSNKNRNESESESMSEDAIRRVDLEPYIGEYYQTHLSDLAEIEVESETEEEIKCSIEDVVRITGTGTGFVVRLYFRSGSDMYSAWSLHVGQTESEAQQLLKGKGFSYVRHSSDGTWQIWENDEIDRAVAYRIENGRISGMYVSMKGYLSM